MAIQNINELYDQLSSNENFSSFNFGSADEFKSYLQELPEDRKQKFYNAWLEDQDISKEQFDSLLKKKEPGRTGILSSALGSIDLGSPSVSETEPQTVTPEVQAPVVPPVAETTAAPVVTPVAETTAAPVVTPVAETTAPVETEEMGIEDFSVSGAKGGPVDVGPRKPKPAVKKEEAPLFTPASALKGRTFDVGPVDQQFAGQKKQYIEQQKTQVENIVKKSAQKEVAKAVIKELESRPDPMIQSEIMQNEFKKVGFEFEVPTGREIMDQSGTRKEFEKVTKQPTDAEIGEILLKNTEVRLSNGVDVGRLFGLPTNTFNKDVYRSYLQKKGFTNEKIDKIFDHYIQKYITENSTQDTETKLSKVEGKDINEKLTKIRQQEDEKGLELLTKQYGPEVALKARELQALMAKRKRPGEAGYDQWNKQMQTLQKEMSSLVGGGGQLYNPDDGKLYDAATAPRRALIFKAYLDDAVKLYKNTDIDKLKQIRSTLYDQVEFLENEYDRMVGPAWRGKEFLKGLSGTITEEQKEGLIQTFAKLDKLKAQLSAINARILTNTDIEPTTTDRTGEFTKQLRAALPGGDFLSKYQTFKDDYNAYIESLSGQIQLKEGEAEKGELALSEEVAGSIGGTIPIMISLAVTKNISPSAAFLRGSGYLRPVSRGILKLTGSTKFANFVTDVVANAAEGYVSYGLAGAGGLTGAAETTFSQTIWDKIGLEKIGANWSPLLRFLSKTAAGTIGETAEEFVGEYANNLSDTGFNFEEAAEKTFGKYLGDFTKKLTVYATTSALLSGVYNSGELGKKSLRLEEVIKLAEEKLKNPNLSEADKEAIKASIDMMKSTNVQLSKKQADEEIAEPISTILPFSEPTAEMEAPGGVTPPPAEGAEAAAFEAGEGPIETAQPVEAQPVNAQEVNNQLAKEGINDVSLQRVEEYGKQIESGNADFERFSPSEQRGLIEGGPIHVEATIITGKSDRAADTQDDSNDRQEEIIKEYAQKKGIWLDNAPAKLREKYGDPFESGKESLVWTDDKRGVVIKSSLTDQYPTLREALDSITLSNAYFPAAKITVVGFGTNEKGEFEIITEQPYIQGVNPTEQEIKEHFNKLGFTENERMYQGKDAFGNEEVIFKDAAPKNVIKTPEGNIVPIDLIAKINKPELNANGTRTLPSTVAEEVTEAAPEAVGAQKDAETQKVDIESRKQKQDNKISNISFNKEKTKVNEQGYTEAVFEGSFLDNYDFLAQGSESTVYLSKDKTHVIKLPEPYSSKDESVYQKRIMTGLLKDILGNSGIEVIGYYEYNGTKNPIFRQDYVEGEFLTEKQVKDYLRQTKGVVEIDNKFYVKYDNKLYRIADFENNVVQDKNGNIVPIDLNISEVTDSKINAKYDAEVAALETAPEAALETAPEAVGAQPEVTEEAAKAIEARPETVQQFEQKAKQVASTKENIAFVQDSVVKNADGTPLVVYNNTNESETRFTEGRPTGLFFTTNAEAFSDYGKTKFAAILNLKNPYYSSMSAVRSAADIQKLKDAGYDGVITHPSYKYDKYVSTLQNEVAAQEDYIKNQDKFNNVEGKDNRNELDLTKAYEFIAFNPEQIKLVESADNKSLSSTEQVTQQAPEVTETEAKPQIIEFVENGKPVKVDLSKLQLVLEEEFIGEETKKTGELPSEGMFSFSIQSEGRKLGEIGVEFQKDNENMKIAYSKIFGTAEKELELDHRFVVRVLQKLKQFFKKSFKGNFIYDSNQGKGIGKKAYGVLAKAIKEEFGKNLISDTRRSEASEALWKSLERDGLAVNRGEYYEYILPTEEVGYGAQNKIVTKQDYDQAVKNLRNPNLPSGFDFSKIGDLVRAAMYHIEAGSRRFADFTREMIREFGRGVRQYLPNVFRRANIQMQQQQAAAPTPAAAPAPTVRTSAQIKQDVTNNYNYIVSTNPNMTEDQIGQELVNRGFSLGEIKRFVPQLRNFWEKQAIDRFEKFVDDFRGKFQTRRNEIEDFMQRNPALDYAQVYDQLKGEYSDFELFKMFYEDGLDGDVLDNLFGTEYRQTIQRAIESKNYNPDFLRDLDKDIKSRKTLNNLGESRSLFAELQDFATAEQLLSAAADVLGLSGIEEAMKTMTDELRAENQQKKLILETYGQIIQGNVTEDNVKLMGEMLSFSGRMLRMGRGLFMTEKGLADLIIKNLETIEIKQSTIFSKKKRAFRVSEGNKKKIQDGVKKYFETKGELDVATKALQEGVDSFTEDTFGNFDKAKENHQRATQDLKGLINRLYGSRQPMFSRFFTSMTSLGLLRFATAAVGLVGNLENMLASMPRRGVGKLLGWTRVLADKIAGAGVYYRLKTGKTPLAAEALKRGTGAGIDPALYRSLAYQEGIRQIKDILFKGLSETSTSKNNFLEGYAEIDGVKDFQLAFNMMKKLTMNFLNKEKFTEEEFATAFDKMLLALEEKDANGNPKLALMHSKGYYTASTLMRGLFGAIPSITGRAIALSGDRYFYKLGFYEFLAAYANSKGITDPKEVGQFIRLHSIGDSDLTKAAEEAGNRRIFAQNNKLVKFNAAAIGSLEKKESSIFGTKIKKKAEGKGFQARAQNIVAAPVVGTRILLNSFAPFVRIPSNAIHKYLRIAFPPYTLVRAFMAQATLSSEMNRYQENYGLDRNAEISETKRKKMEADRIKLFEQQRMTAQYWTEFFQGSQLYVLAYLLVEAGAIGAPYGDDEESKKRARAAGIAQQDAGKINLSQLLRSLSGESRGRTMQDGDATFDYRNLGMLGFVISSMASIRAAYRTSKLEQKKMLGTEENMVNTIGAKMLVESLQNGITQLSFIQNISSLLGALKEGGFEKAGKDFTTNLITTTATVPTLSYGVFSPFDKTQGISSDAFRNFNPDLEERDYFMGEVGARVWTKLTARSPLYGFGMRDENGEFIAPLKALGFTPSKFYRPQIGPFGERLYKKSTFWDTRSGSKTDKFLAFLQASIDPFSFSDYEGFVSNVKPYNEKQEYKRGDFVEWNNNVWIVLKDKLKGVSPKTAKVVEYTTEDGDYFLIDKKYNFMDPDEFRRDKQGSQKTKLLFDFVNLYEEAVGDRKPYAVFSKLYKDPVKFKDEDGEFAIYIPIDEQRKLSIMRGEAMSRVFDDQTVESYISAIDKAADNENMTDSEYKEYVKDIFKTYFLGPIDNENNRGGGLVDKVNEAISKVENKPEYVRIVRDGIVKSIEEGNLTKEEFDRLKKIPEAAGFVNELNEKKLKFRN